MTITNHNHTQPPQDAPFEFFEPSSPIYTSPRFLPPARLEHCQVMSHHAASGWLVETLGLLCFFAACCCFAELKLAVF